MHSTDERGSNHAVARKEALGRVGLDWQGKGS